MVGMIILVCLASSQLTRLLTERYSIGLVRASAGSTLAFVLLLSIFPVPEKDTVSAAFLGASFIGMSRPSLFTARDLLFAALIFAGFFLYALPFNQGLGGALGLAAFGSSLIVHRFRYRLSPSLP